MDNPFTTNADPGDEKVEKVEKVEEVQVGTPHAEQLKVVQEVTARLEAAARGRLEAEIGLQEDYWVLRDELNRAHRRLEELR